MTDKSKNFKLSKKALAKLQNKKQLQEEFAAGKSAQEIVGFTEAAMSSFYEAAIRLFEGKHYQDAYDAFLFLVSMNSYKHEYWLGLGMSLQMTGDFETAVDAYEMAAIMNLYNPVPYLYLAKCLFSMHDRENALEALNLAIECAGDRPEFDELRSEAEKAKEILEKSF